MFVIYLGLGSNMGNKKANILSAYQLIEEKIGEIAIKSSFYETKAWGIENQENFLNTVIELKTNKYPLEILKIILKIEEDLGRKKIEKWGPRMIDIDLLFFENFYFSTPQLTLPHPFIASRNFVLVPMNEINSRLIHPKLQKTIQDIQENSSDESWIKKL